MLVRTQACALVVDDDRRLQQKLRANSGGATARAG